MIQKDDLESDYEKEIDLQWIEEYEKLVKVENNYIQETMDSVSVCVFYMNKERSIKTIISDKIALFPSEDGATSILSKDRILQFILSKKVHLNVKYDLFDILYFNFPLESENFYSFVNGGGNEENGENGKDGKTRDIDNMAHYLRSGTIVNDVHFEKSVFIFHEINTLYFFLIEKDIGENHRHTLKSILKKESDISSKEDPTSKDPISNNKNNKNKEYSKKVRIFSKPTKSYRAFTKKVYEKVV
jgi:hypothetical protein